MTTKQNLPYGYDPSRFATLHAKVKAGEIQVGPPAAPAGMEPLRPQDALPLPEKGSADFEKVFSLGESALKNGEIGIVILAGGAATRFGGSVKGLVKVLGDRTFLDLKLEDADAVGKKYGRPVPVAIMTSNATHDDIQKYLNSKHRSDVFIFVQAMLPRLTLDLNVYLDAQHEMSFAPSGHGDFYRALLESKTGHALFNRNVRHILFSNVDNLGATLDPLAVGMHLMMGKDLTMEITPRQNHLGAQDKGGAPVRVGNRLQLYEQADPLKNPVINTNNIWFNLSALLERKIDLPFQVVKKKVDNVDVLQFEQVAGDAPSLIDNDGRQILSTAMLQVPRVDPMTSRFEPVKEPQDLAGVAERMKSRYQK